MSCGRQPSGALTRFKQVGASQIEAPNGVWTPSDVAAINEFMRQFRGYSLPVRDPTNAAFQDVSQFALRCTDVKGAAYTARAGELVLADLTLGNVTISLPSDPMPNDIVGALVQVQGSALYIDTAGKLIDTVGPTTTYGGFTSGGELWIYTGDRNTWQIISARIGV